MTAADGRLIFLHGLAGSSQGIKATLLRSIFPHILTPDFGGELEQRMAALGAILGDRTGWKIVGSSFGGLMAALFACRRPAQVERMVLLAPALIWPDFTASPPQPIEVPVLIYHGSQDKLIPVELVRELAEQVFLNLTFRIVDDDHGLYRTVNALDWPELLGEIEA